MPKYCQNVAPQVWYSPGNNIRAFTVFAIYINDLPNCLSHSEPRMCADDTLLSYSYGNIHSIQSSLNEDLLNINRWLTANKLTLNMTKTEFGLTGSRQKLNNLPSLPSLNINNDRIKHSYCSKSLKDSENNLAVPLPRTNYSRNSLCYSGAVLWNILPTYVR